MFKDEKGMDYGAVHGSRIFSSHIPEPLPEEVKKGIHAILVRAEEKLCGS